MSVQFKLSDFRTGEKRKVKVGEKDVVVFYMGGDRFFAFDAYCPHLGCDILKVGVIIREELVCQCHFSHFSVFDGKVKKGASKKDIKTYKVEVIGDTVHVSDNEE
ncbi:(2Fe-2S)-binding protein [Sulfolobales archaeon HS-7]|nr:(2Fe-2S)-binding protein [Sulfolobales archaeon HS-7]